MNKKQRKILNMVNDNRGNINERATAYSMLKDDSEVKKMTASVMCFNLLGKESTESANFLNSIKTI